MEKRLMLRMSSQEISSADRMLRRHITVRTVPATIVTTCTNPFYVKAGLTEVGGGLALMRMWGRRQGAMRTLAPSRRRRLEATQRTCPMKKGRRYSCLMTAAKMGLYSSYLSLSTRFPYIDPVKEGGGAEGNLPAS